MAAPAMAVAAAPAAMYPQAPPPEYQQAMPPPMYQQPMAAPMYQQPAPVARTERVATAPYAFKSFDGGGAIYDQDNLDLVMAVPIQISVELGRTKRKIKDIADLGVGNIVELDRQAGDQVDVIANGRLIAKGDVVVVDDNYSVRITEIVKQPEEFA
jgi:flagellar motor switch protein FliN/FliY